MGINKDRHLITMTVIGVAALSWSWFEYFMWIRREFDEAANATPTEPLP
jgi:hypothetical protein